MKTQNKMRWIVLLLGILALILLLSACGSAARADSQVSAARPADEAQRAAPALQEPETKTLYIGPKLADCTGAGAQKCLMVREHPDDDYQYFYQPIAGFDYEEGYAYEIVVSVEQVENPPADGSSLQYSLVEIISKTPVAEASEAPPAQSSGLEGGEWRLVSYLGPDGMTEALEEAPITITFTDGRAVGSAGCNRYFTTYQIDGDALSVDEAIGRTRMACPDPVMAQEEAYVKLLPQAATFEIHGDALAISDQKGDVLLRFRSPARTDVEEAPAATPQLVGPVWQWQRTEMSNDETISVDDPGGYTIQFNEDGSLLVKADCKQTAGEFTDENGALTIRLNPTTMQICSDKSLADEFFKELSFAGAYVFTDEGNLVINMKMDGGNIIFAKAEEVTAAPGETPASQEAMQQYAGVYKVILPPAEEGGALRVATLALDEDGAFDLTLLTLGETEGETYEGVWKLAEEGKIQGKITSVAEADEFTLDVGENGDLKLEGSDLELINIDETIPLHKQLAIPVITEQKAYVTLDIQAGNPLDPFIVSVNGGGTFDAAALGGECTGYVNTQPVARIHWEGQADLSKIFFYSDHDPTLIVQSPDGAFHCNDDASDLLLDPSLTFEDPQDGIYNIWVGSYYPDQLIPGVLVVTTREDVSVETFTLNGLIKRGPMVDVTERTDAKPAEALISIIQRQKQKVKKLKVGKPHTIRVTAEGDNPAFEYDVPGQLCNGFINDKPDLVFDWTGETDALTIYFEGDGDATLVVTTPGGDILCNDDANVENANPLVAIPNPAQGRYAVFVGRVHPDAPVKGKLTVTDAPDAGPETLAPQPAPASTPPAQSDKQ